MNMIKLTIKDLNKSAYINVDSIEMFTPSHQNKKCSAIYFKSGSKITVNESVEEIYSLIFNKENMQTLKRKVVILDNTNRQLEYNKLKLVRLRKFCSGEDLKEAKNYVDSLDLKPILLYVNVGLASEEFILQQIKEVGLNEYFVEIREEN